MPVYGYQEWIGGELSECPIPVGEEGVRFHHLGIHQPNHQVHLVIITMVN